MTVPDRTHPLVLQTFPWLVCLLIAAAMHWLVGPFVGDYGVTVLQKIGVCIIAAVGLNLVNGCTGQFSMGHAGFMAIGGYIAAATSYYSALLFFGSTALQPGLFNFGVLIMLLGIVLGALVAAGFGYIVGLPSLRLRGDYLAIVTLGFGEIIRVLLQLTSSQIPYKSAIAFKELLKDSSDHTAASLILSFSPSDPAPLQNALLDPANFDTARSLAQASDVQQWANLIDHPISTLATFPLNGSLGFADVPGYGTLFWVFLICAAACLAAYRIKYSSIGRAFLSIREDEVAARAMGINLTLYKVRAFVLAAFLGGLAGGLWAHAGQNYSPTEAGFLRSFEIIIFVVLGGLGSISGAALAAILLTVLAEVLRGPQQTLDSWWVWALLALTFAFFAFLLRIFKRRGAAILLFMASVPLSLILLAVISYFILKFTNGKVNLGEYRMILYAAALVLVMILRPNGLLGLKEIWDFFRTPPSNTPNPTSPTSTSKEAA